ncbi:MAG: hypothetical protein K2P68_10980 [Sphingomonas sp.]|nr:hypothetical protein [Sphingomonas sp.]
MSFVIAYHQLIEQILVWSGQSDKFVHMQVGLVLWLGTAVLSRQHLCHGGPLVVIVVFEVANEIIDRLYLGFWNLPDTIGDAAATWAWPVILVTALLSNRKLRTKFDAPTLKDRLRQTTAAATGLTT